MREDVYHPQPNPHAARSHSCVDKITEPLFEFRNPLQFLSNLLLSFASALALFVLIPITRWIATPAPPDTFPFDPNMFVEPAPKELYEPPPKPPETKKEEPMDEIKFQPTIEDLEVRMLKVGNGGFALPSWSFEKFEVPTIEEILEIGDVDVIPRAVKTIAPVYPADMKRNGIEDRVIVEFIVDERGYVSHPTVLKGNYGSFNKASLDAVRRWKFEPGQKDGSPVKVRMRLPLDFKVNR